MLEAQRCSPRFFFFFPGRVHSVSLAFGKLSWLSLISGPNLCYISGVTRNDSRVLRCPLVLTQRKVSLGAGLVKALHNNPFHSIMTHL